MYVYQLCILLSFACNLSAQVPQGLQYQAVIRDNTGNPLLNTPVQFRFTLEDNAGNQIFYQETQSVSTNALGGINLVIGSGNASQGNFSLTDWKNGDVRLRVEIDPTGAQNYSPFGITSLQSVPYALYAGSAGSLVDQNGNDWGPENDLDEQTLSVNGNQLAISNGNAVTLPTGSGGDNWGSQTIATEPELTGNGTLASPLSIATQGADNGDVLKWNGNSWAPASDNYQEYSAGEGIAFIADVIHNTGDDDHNPTNEIQTLSINGNVVSLTDGGSINLPTYTEGTGIDINVNTISATSTQAIWNANQLRGFNVMNNTPVAGNYLQYSASGWMPANGPSQTWVQNGNNIYYSTGNVGFGVTTPLERIHVFNEDKIRMDDQTFGKWASISLEFSSNILPEVDDVRSLGIASRRWTEVWATDGTINTSDAREKTNIQELEYGLEDIMKLRPVSYSWTTRPESGTKLGLIAQELETVIPEVVANPNRTPSLNREPGETEDHRLGVYYSDLIPVLIKAIQEQEEKIRQLEHEIKLLKQ